LSPRPFPHLHLALAALGIVSLLTFNGCGDDNNDNPTNPGGGATSTSFTGTFVNGSEGGLMTVTVNTTTLARALRAATAVTASGVITPDGGSPISLTGTYDSATDSLYLNGGGYAFGGQYDGSGAIAGIAGLYTGPNGAGQFGCATGSSASIGVYCGTYQNQAVTETGNWNLVTSGSYIVGLAVPSGQTFGLGLEGTLTGTGTTRTITVGSDDGNGGLLTATGTLNTTTHAMSGTWHTTQDAAPVDSGSWSGNLCTTGNL
jgi:hypothetical protein